MESRTILFFLLFCVLFILQFQLATLDEELDPNVAQNHPEKPLLSKIFLDTVSLLRKSHTSSWEKIKTVIHDLQMQFSPPNLDFRGTREVGEESGVTKEAIEKVFGKSKDTVEESAESAAKVVGEAIHKTTQKVRDETATDSDHHSKAEL
ncbi:hypothetical protein VNO78_10648 [Psophocarpus tetragonolobus]|uniref:Uncharacterized protein n=1 Tax=Psophocarpus tetragonolobus TaxID=3891 RepID=A0AAN9SMG6_PSOTE